MIKIPIVFVPNIHPDYEKERERIFGTPIMLDPTQDRDGVAFVEAQYPNGCPILEND